MMRIYYLAWVFGVLVPVTSEGQALAQEVVQGVDLVDRWARVRAHSLTEACALVETDQCMWMS